MNTHSTSTRLYLESGFTLIEVMIAMLLSVILLGGVVQVSSGTKASYRANEAVAQLQENGRFSTEIMARDIRMADFWGCAGNISKVTNNLDSAGSGYVDFVNNGGIGGTEGGANPDTLILRGGFNNSLQVESPFGPQASADIKVTAGNDLNQFDIVMVSDCTSADIFQVSNPSPAAGILVHNRGAGDPGNYNPMGNSGCPGANAHCLSKVYDAKGTVYRLQEITYTIAAGASGQPALFRSGNELVDGIEDLQVMYGEDIDGSGSANRYVDADQVSDMNTVVSIRIALVARSYENNVANGQTYDVFGTTVTSTDKRLRQVYTSTVSIRNRLK